MDKILKHAVMATMLVGTLFSTAANCQTVTTEDVSTTGVVASSSANTLVVRTAAGQFVLFVFAGNVVKPPVIANGATVTVLSRPREDGVQVAHYVRVAGDTSGTTTTGAAATGAAAGTAASSRSGVSSPGGTAGSQDVIPPEVRDMERSIKRQARRYGAGVEGGVGLDPEVVIIGLNARMGPIFNSDLYFRPSADFAFGEVTKMFQINLDALYRLPLSPRTGRWGAYLGAGPNFSFVSQNFSKAEAGDNGVDFSDFSFKAGLNVVAGLQYRSGIFYELRAGVWTIPTLRLIIGYQF